MVSSTTHPPLQVMNLSKSFAGVRALSGIHLTVERGSVHAIMGENGAGKSTLMKILAGFFPPDEGEILFKGCPVRLRSPHQALRQGISMIHQELLPFRNLTAAENIFMGRELAVSGTGWLKRREMQREAEDLLHRLGARVSPLTKMKELRIAEMQTVEIAKALIHQQPGLPLRVRAALGETRKPAQRLCSIPEKACYSRAMDGGNRQAKRP